MTSPRRRRWLVVGVGLTLVGGTAVTLAAAGRDQAAGQTEGAGPVLDGAPLDVDASGVLAPSLSAPPEIVAAPAPTPEAAAAEFFDAEIAGDFAASYDRLSADDRAQAGNRGEWITAHDRLPVYEEFTPTGGTEQIGGDAVVPGTVRMQPVVDQVVGIVPASASARIVVVAEDGGWRVAYRDSVFVPDALDDESAPAAAVEWVADRQACAKDDGAVLLGDPRVGAALCGTTDDWSPGPVERIDRAPDSTPFLTAFGPDGIASLRVVAFEGPAPLTVVLAPLGDRWIVVGAE